MAKGTVRKKKEFLINGKPARLIEIVDTYLTNKLGEYLNAREITTITGIKGCTLRKWRNQGILRAELLKGRLYYSVEDLVNTIKSADIKDIRF